MVQNEKLVKENIILKKHINVEDKNNIAYSN